MIILDSQSFPSKGPGGGGIQGIASEALLVPLAARDKDLREVAKDDLGRLVVYGSNQAHSYIQKTCQLCFITMPEKIPDVELSATNLDNQRRRNF
ncbi:hypothetical protein L2E82_51738 [Cichorium intybus]|nr:hypothetical protein L2E82_51738 [Cichorium intybus]